MTKSKRYYADRVKIGLQNDHPDIDWKIDERDIFAVIDSLVNNDAKAGFYENWKFGAAGIGEQYLTTWDNITVVDVPKKPSYFDIPFNYADLPMGRGIDSIWPIRWRNDGKNHNVVIMTQRDVRLFASNMAGGLDGRLGGYVQASRFIFNQAGVKTAYGNMGIRLVVRDSSIIPIDQPYPIPSDKEELIIQRAIAFFREKRSIPANRVRDKIDQP